MQPILCIRLLGEFSLICNEASLTTVNTPRLQSLLAYLLLHRDTRQSRQHLAYLFWPGSSDAQARTNLRNLIHQLRQALPDAPKFLCTDGATIQWRPDAPCTLDVAEFENALALGALRQAVDLYHGDLLPACYDDWIAPERERLQQQYVGALRRLIQQLENEQDYRSAIAYTHRLLHCDPLHEATFRQLMRLYAESGDRTGIVRTYNTCATVLQRELDIEPSVETHEAYDDCLKVRTLTEQVTERAPTSHPDTRLDNLPLQLTRFIGREREMSEVKGLVAAQRLVTLTGAGGVGKTRLALAVAEDLVGAFADGVWHIDLASLSDPALVVQVAAAVLGVREEMGQPLLARLTDYLHRKRLLLILDNCEHLMAAVRSVAQTLLHTAPDVRILVTSRVVLGMTGEVTWRVPSLSAPDMSRSAAGAKPESESASRDENLTLALRQYESVQFFADRAAAVLPTFALTNQNVWAVGQVCQQLDGIPLALELAAARVKVFTAQQIADHLKDALQLLTQGSPTALPRHQTMRATLDWSHALLTGEEQVLFRRLSVFAGGATFEAVEAICCGDGIEGEQMLNLLSGLVDKSLVSVEPSGKATRFRLHEVACQYAHIRLMEAGEETQVRNRHLDFFCSLAEALEPDLLGMMPPGAIRRLTQEHDNLRVALEWSTNEHGNAQSGLRLVAALPGFWEVCGLLTKERSWLEELLVRGGATAPPAMRAKALRGAGQVAYYQCDFEAARSFFEQSLALDRELDNRPRMADTLGRLGFLLNAQCEYAAAEPFYQESLAISRSLGDPRRTAETLSELGYMAFRQGDCARARSLLEESLTLFRDPDDQYSKARALHFLGHVTRFESDYAQARSLYTQSLTILIELCNSWGMFYSLEAFGYLAVAEGQFERAARLFGATERLAEEIGTSIVPTERTEHERDVAAARAALGESAFATAWAVGRTMTLDGTLAYALGQMSG